MGLRTIGGVTVAGVTGEGVTDSVGQKSQNMLRCPCLYLLSTRFDPKEELFDNNLWYINW